MQFSQQRSLKLPGACLSLTIIADKHNNFMSTSNILNLNTHLAFNKKKALVGAFLGDCGISQSLVDTSMILTQDADGCHVAGAE